MGKGMNGRQDAELPGLGREKRWLLNGPVLEANSSNGPPHGLGGPCSVLTTLVRGHFILAAQDRTSHRKTQAEETELLSTPWLGGTCTQ